MIWRRYTLTSLKPGCRAPSCAKCAVRSERPGQEGWTYRWLASGRGTERVESCCAACADPAALALPSLSFRPVDAIARRAYERLYYAKNRVRIAKRRGARYRIRKAAGSLPPQPYRKERVINRHRAVRLEALVAYSGSTPPKCGRCGFADDHRALQLDHVNNDGAAQRRAWGMARGGGGVWLYRKLKRLGYPSGFQVLCANCNFIKEWEHRGRR